MCATLMLVVCPDKYWNLFRYPSYFPNPQRDVRDDKMRLRKIPWNFNKICCNFFTTFTTKQCKFITLILNKLIDVHRVPLHLCDACLRRKLVYIHTGMYVHSMESIHIKVTMVYYDNWLRIWQNGKRDCTYRIPNVGTQKCVTQSSVYSLRNSRNLLFKSNCLSCRIVQKV